MEEGRYLGAVSQHNAAYANIQSMLCDYISFPEIKTTRRQAFKIIFHFNSTLPETNFLYDWLLAFALQKSFTNPLRNNIHNPGLPEGPNCSQTCSTLQAPQACSAEFSGLK